MVDGGPEVPSVNRNRRKRFCMNYRMNCPTVSNGWLFAIHCRCLEAAVRMLGRQALVSDCLAEVKFPVRRHKGQQAQSWLAQL